MKITQEEFNRLPVIDGVKRCPFGNYSLISSFAEHCSFAEYCSFAERCSFAEHCSFAEGCSFAGGCRFAERCSFEKNCSFENGKIPKNYKTPLHKISGFGSRQNSELYFWDFQDGIFVRAGCFFGTQQKFTERVIEKYGENHEYITISNMLKELLK